MAHPREPLFLTTTGVAAATGAGPGPRSASADVTGGRSPNVPVMFSMPSTGSTLLYREDRRAGAAGDASREPPWLAAAEPMPPSCRFGELVPRRDLVGDHRATHVLGALGRLPRGFPHIPHESAPLE